MILGVILKSVLTLVKIIVGNWGITFLHCLELTEEHRIQLT